MNQGYSKCTFDHEWRSLYSYIFAERPSEARRFANEGWIEALFPEPILLLPEVDHVLHALVGLINSEGDREIVVTSPEVEPQFQDAFLVEATVSSLTDVYFEPAIGHFDHVMFSRSASWGVFYANELSFSAIGGSQSFMRSLLASLGGEAAVKASFLDYWSNQPYVDYETKKLLLESVGW